MAIFAGTVLSANRNTDKDTKELRPGGNILCDLKVKSDNTNLDNAAPLEVNRLITLRINDPAHWDTLMSAGLGKGATVAVPAQGIHDHDPSRDGTLPAKGNLPPRPKYRLMGPDIQATWVVSGVKLADTSTTNDESRVRSAANIVKNLASSAMAAFKGSAGTTPEQPAAEPDGSGVEDEQQTEAPA